MRKTLFPHVATVNTIDVDLRTFLDLKKKLKKREKNWDTFGQPSGKYDYKVKYSRPPSVNTPIKSITSSGWRNEPGRGKWILRPKSPQYQMPKVGDNQIEHRTIRDLFRIGIHQELPT